MTVIFKAPGVTIPGLSKLYRDKVISAGSKYLYDFEDPYCNPFARSANLTAGQQFRDLVTGSALGTVFGSTVANGASGKGIKLPGVNDNGVDFGTGYETSQDAILVILWLMTRTGDAPAANSHVFGRDLSAGSGQYFMTGGADGKTVSFTLGLNGSLGTSVNAGGAMTANVPMQIAFLWSGDSRTGWTNNAAETTNANAASTMNTGTTWTEGLGRKTTAGSTAVLGFNTGWQGSVFRVYKEDVKTTVGGTDQTAFLAWARAQVALDYTNNISRFS